MLFKRCRHLNRRCIHGDEIWQAMKVYPFLWWKQAQLRRQRCLDCGKALDRDAICTITGKDVHVEYGEGVCNCSAHDITRIGAAHADDCPAAN